MVFEDFEYDGKRLSDFGFMICSFEDGGMETRSSGGDLEFTTVKQDNGKHWLLTQSGYNSTLTATLYICPSLCETGGIIKVTEEQNRAIMRWLNRPTFCKFKPLRWKYDTFFYGTFMVKAQTWCGQLVGYELEVITDRPFGLGETQEYSFSVGANETYTINDTSDEVGFIYPEMTVKTTAAGTLRITNSIEPDRRTVINNCEAGELFTFKHPIVTTSSGAHKVQEDYNYNFPRISNTYENSVNTLTFSLPSEVTISYNPIRKVGI